MHLVHHDQVQLDGKHTARCAFPNCNSRIISVSNPKVVSIEGAPNLLKVSRDLQETSLFYQVDDVWKFDNIGVSRPSKLQEIPPKVNGEKVLEIERLLICSDCDKGPIGCAGHIEGEPKEVNSLRYFLSVNSVLFQVE